MIDISGGGQGGDRGRRGGRQRGDGDVLPDTPLNAVGVGAGLGGLRHHRRPGWPAVTAETTPVKIWDLTDRMDTDTGSGTRALWKGIDFPPVEL